MGKTCIMKIMERAAGRSVQVGDRVWCKVDLASARDFGGANCVLQFEQEMGRDAKVWDPDKVAFTFDLQAPSHSEKVSNNQKIIREFAKRQGISYLFDINHGIGQHVMLEAGLVKPGDVILGTDSHMNLLGAVGAFATGVGNSDVAAEDKLDETAAKELVDHQVCVVTMAPIVNKDVAEAGVKSLTKEQLISIFTGKTTNWKDVGGPDEDIVLVTRPESSGTRATFQKYALDGNEEASNTSMETDDSGVLLTNVKSTNGAIGYVALSYLTGDAGVETVAIDDVEPTLENTYSGKYPVWTFEHMYTKGEPNEVTKAFLDYITGDEYGAQMEKLGYGVASKMTVTEH